VSTPKPVLLKAEERTVGFEKMPPVAFEKSTYSLSIERKREYL